MITQAGVRPSSIRRSIRRSIASASLNGTGIVMSDDGLRDPERRTAGTARSNAVADLVVGDADRDHHVVVVAVVGAEDLHDRVAAGRSAGDPDRVHRRLGARVDVAPLRQPPAPRQLLADDDGVLRRRREVGAELDPVASPPSRSPGARGPAPSSRSRCGSRGSTFPSTSQTCAPFAVREVDRPRIAHLVRGGDPADEALLRALVERRASRACARRAALPRARSAP